MDNGHVDQPERWLTLKEAAETMGCSVVTLRRLIKKNRVQARQVTTPHGPAWRVLSSSVISLPRVITGPPEQGLVAQADQGAGQAMVELVRLVNQLQEDKAILAQRIGTLETLLRIAEERVEALEAPKDGPSHRLEMAPESTPPAEAVSRAPTSLWSRLVGWLR